MQIIRKIVLWGTVTLLAVWMVANTGRLTHDSDAVIRLAIGGAYALLIVLRWKPAGDGGQVNHVLTIWIGALASALAITGIVFNVKQFEWIGLIALTYSALRWAMQPRYGRDLLLAVFVLYWMHPLPSRIFGAFQLEMQSLSVSGAEWFLHCLNKPAWADLNGFVLWSGMGSFGVDQACSGMKTSVTVFLCALGTGILLRFRWYEMLVLAAAGILQVVAFNILRISMMALAAPRMPEGWANTFLHDTLGVLLLVAIVIVNIEGAWWRSVKVRRQRVRSAIETGEAEMPDKATTLPRFWRHVNTFKWAGFAVLALAAVFTFAGMKKRPAHRAVMIAGTVEGLLERNAAAAERATREALRLAPRNRDLRAQLVQALVLQARHREALAELAKLGDQLTAVETVMKSWALMATGRPEEADAAIETLPAAQKQLPGVAIIRAEYAAVKNRPDIVAQNVQIAAGSRLTVRRVRDLFPYLAAHELWNAIADADYKGIPYDKFEHCLIAIRAHIETMRLAEASRLVKEALKAWPNDVRVLTSLYSLALGRPGSEWEEMFAATLMGNVETIDADRAATYLNHSFQLNRPDLAWLAYRRLSKLDPEDPSLLLAVARYGDTWFTFRKHRVGMRAAEAGELVNLGEFMKYMDAVQPFKAICARIPMVDAVRAGPPDARRARFVKLCLDELGRREKSGRLAARHELIYPAVLAMAGRLDDAHARLDAVEKKHPNKRQDILFQRASFFAQEQKWQQAYETLRNLKSESEMPGMAVDLLMIGALMNMNLGVGALEMAESLKRTYTESREVDGLLAALWDTFGFKDQALFILSNGERRFDSAPVVQLLFDTGRVREAERLGERLGIRIVRRARQAAWLPPAENAVSRNQWPELLAAAELKAESARALERSRESRSPFMKAFENLTADWYGEAGKGGAADPGAWLAIGRSDLEKGAAMHRLVILHARQKEYDKASAAADRALETLPRSPILWRIKVALAEGRLDIVEKAVGNCPEDPELRLAALVARTAKDGSAKRFMDEARDFTAERKLPVEAIVRAGDLMLRKGAKDAATLCARSALARSPGFLPANMLGLRCALAGNDLKWATDCAVAGAEHGLDPTPFYKAVVAIAGARGATDAGVERALNYLHDRFPGEREWRERLAYLHFNRGDTKRAGVLLVPSLEGGIKGMDVQTLIIAAECLRLEGNLEKASDLLQAACREYPESLSLLNNLVYTLALQKGRAGQALEMLAGLMRRAGNDSQVLDTAALVYLRNGQLDKAEEFMDKAGKRENVAGYPALESELNRAELLFRRGKLKAALEKLEAVRRSTLCPPLMDVEARRMFEAIEARLAEERK